MSKNIILSVIILLILTALVYFVFQNDKLHNYLNSQNPQEVEETETLQNPSSTSEADKSPSQTVDPKSQIIKSVNTKKYAQLVEFMTTPQVTFTIMSSDCCGKIAPEEVVDQLSYFDKGIPFDFDQNLPTITNLKAKNTQLKEAYIGISENGEYLIALKLNAQNLIEEMQVSVSYKLYNQ